MLLLFTHKSHTGPPLRYIPMIVCKGTKKQAQYKTKCEVFSILAYKYAAFIRSVQKYGYIYIMYARKISYEIFAYIIDYQ